MSVVKKDVVAPFDIPEFGLLALFNQHTKMGVGTARHTTPTFDRITTAPGATEGQVLTLLPLMKDKMV